MAHQGSPSGLSRERDASTERGHQWVTLRQSYTRIYFADAARNGADPILALVPAERRDTLIAKRETRDGKLVYRFDIRMLGDGETVFFEV